MWDLHQCLDRLRFYAFSFRLDLTGSRDAEDKGRTEAHYSDNHTQQVWEGLHPLEGQQQHDVRGCACRVAEQFVHLKACSSSAHPVQEREASIIVSRPQC